MIEEDAQEIRSFHVCSRPDCTRVFREGGGYSDRVGGEFEDVRANQRPCPACGASLYLAAVDHVRKMETWECPQSECEFGDYGPEPSGR